MNKIGRKVYFDVSNGNVILDTGERYGEVVSTTVEEDIQSYKVLNERIPSTFSFIELEYGQFSSDFSECSGFRVNLSTLELEFTYPDLSEEPSEPIYRVPLSIEVDDLKTRTTANEDLLISLLMG